MASASNIPKYSSFSFSPSIPIYSWFGIYILSVIRPLPLLIIFLWQILLLEPGYIFSSLALWFAIFFFFFFFLINFLITSMYFRCLLSFCAFVSLKPAEFFPDYATEWHHRYYKQWGWQRISMEFTSLDLHIQLFFPAVNFTLQFYMVYSYYYFYYWIEIVTWDNKKFYNFFILGQDNWGRLAFNYFYLEFSKL